PDNRDAGDDRGDGQSKGDQDTQPERGSIVFAGFHGIHREPRKQSINDQAEQHKRGSPDQPPDVIAHATLVIAVRRVLSELQGLSQLGFGRNGGGLCSFKFGFAVNFGGGADRKRFPLALQGTSDDSGKSGLIEKSKEVCSNASVQGQRLPENRQAAADLSVGVKIQHLVKGQNVSPNVSTDGDVICERANVPIDLATNPRALRKANDIARDVPCNVQLLAEGENIAIHGAIHAKVIASEENVAFDVFALRDAHGIALAKFRGVGCRRCREQQTQACKYHRQRGSPSDVFPEGIRGRTCQNGECENFKQREHGLPSFPEGPLKNQ